MLSVNFHGVPYSVWNVLQVSHNKNWRSHHQGHSNSSNSDNRLPLLMMVWFIKLAVHSAGFGSYSAWLTNVMGIRAASLVLVTAIGMYVHFPKHVCEQCRRSPHLSTGQSVLQPLHPPETEYSNSTPTRLFSNPHSTVTTETTPLILHPSKVGHQNDRSHTSFSIAHSPVTTVTAPLVYRNGPSHWSQVLACPLTSHYKHIYIFVHGFV